MEHRSHSVPHLRMALCGLTIWCATLLMGSPVGAEKYSLTDLGTLGGTSSEALGISSAGHVVGNSRITSGAVRAFVYSNFTMTDLGNLSGFQALGSNARGVNTVGQVVGRIFASHEARAFLYSNGTMTDLGALNSVRVHAWANGINDVGQVVGQAATIIGGDGNPHAFIYSNGTMMDLGTLGGTSSEAFGINAVGQVVGRSYIDGNTATHAFLYSNGTMTDLGTLGGTSSTARGINAAGQVVGNSYITGNTSEHGFLYGDGTMIDLGTLGGTSSIAKGINATGQVVGSADTTDNVPHAFVYSDGSLLDLNSLLDSTGSGWTLSDATAINDKGQIVGTGISPLNQVRAILLSPGNNPPVCSNALSFPSVLWSPDHQFVPVVVMGVTDPDGDAVKVTVIGVTQDESVNTNGNRNMSPDAVIEAGAATVRAERSGDGNGRVYQVSFKARDDKGGFCTGKVTVGVPHSLGKGLAAVDDGQIYDSTVP